MTLAHDYSYLAAMQAEAKTLSPKGSLSVQASMPVAPLAATAARILGVPLAGMQRLPLGVRMSARLLEFILIGICAWFAASLLWLALGEVPSPRENKQSSNNALLASSLATSDLRTSDPALLTQFDPFSRTLTSTPVADTSSAPETQLNLSLNGVRLQNDGNGSAIIKVGDERQRTFVPGDTIIGGVRLVAVYSDHVRLNTRGREETLYLPGAKPETNADPISTLNVKQATSNSAQPLEPADGNAGTVTLSAFRGSRKDLEMLLRGIRFTPERGADKSVTGWRLAPRADASAFASAGLKDGDLLTGINAYKLTSTDQLQEIIDALGSEPTITLHLLRAGQPLSLRFTAPVR